MVSAIIFYGGLEDMIIGVDAGGLGVSDKRLQTGVYVSVLELLKHLSKLDSTNKYLLYSLIPIDNKILKELGSNFKNKVVRPKKYWLSLSLSIEIFRKKPDIFLGFNQALSRYHPEKSVVLVHDLAFEHFPDCYKDSGSRLSRLTRFAVDHANIIVTPSIATKKDIVRFYGVREEKIEVIYHGITSHFRPAIDRKINSIKKKYKLNKPYFLFIGSLKPVKNIPRLLEGFSLFLTKTKKPYKLVLTGSDYWLDKEINERIKRLKLDDQVINLGFIPGKDLPALYSGCLAFVSPSLYEGFGLPILEAMACGVPVITSDRGAIPEIVENAAIIVNPLDGIDISRALIKVATDRKLVLSLRKRGIKRAKMFNWDNAANKYLNIIKKI